MSKDSPPPDNDLGQNAIPMDHISTDRWNPRGPIVPPEVFYVCAVCGFIYARSQMVKFRNKYYCKPQECNRDIVGIRLKEDQEAQLKNQGLSDRFYTRGQ